MNYRHAFHAGNFADVIKHLILLQCLKCLAKKEAPFFVLDAFAGIGKYDFNSDEAQRSPEYNDGIMKLWDINHKCTAITEFLENQSLICENDKNFYAGSPAIVISSLRDQDRAIFNELHPVQNKILLEQSISLRDKFRNAHFKLMEIDAYLTIKSTLPPKERRGLIIIDPPFEKPNEFIRMNEAVENGLKRFATGVYFLWYANKNSNETNKFIQNLKKFNKPMLNFDFRRDNLEAQSGLNGCGVVVINPPFGLKDTISDASLTLKSLLGKKNHAKFDIDAYNLD